MADKPTAVRQLVEAVAVLIGWGFFLMVLIGTYYLGAWLAPHIGWQGSKDTLGLLTAISAVWIFEHRHFTGKLDKLGDR